MIIAAMMPTISLISESSVERVQPIDPAAAVVIPTSWAGPVASRTSCAISVVEVARADVEEHRRERRLPVLGEESRGLAGTAERVGDAVDVRLLAGSP